ncbi:MAG TPA: DUF6036 family nucleotidyltransferase [Tepidisphaeraceae bacterium]|nr:DUF6036 family nucleotidyltransferase [Tepidisphaeraceae bacterium]
MTVRSTVTQGIWDLALGGGPVDAEAWARALDEEAGAGTDRLDFRSRLLIRDGLDALAAYWGRKKFDGWLADAPAGLTLGQIWREDLGPTRFPSLKTRLMQPIRGQVVRQFLREIGVQIDVPVRIVIGGAVALILAGELERATEDIDLVDEVPEPIRVQRLLLDRMAARFGLHLAHFQSHYLPTGWESRIHSMGPFGALDVFVIDPVDVLLGKLFSSREKDRDDLRALLPRTDRELLSRRLRQTCGALMAQAELAKAAAENWYIVLGEPLPAVG